MFTSMLTSANQLQSPTSMKIQAGSNCLTDSYWEVEADFIALDISEF